MKTHHPAVSGSHRRELPSSWSWSRAAGLLLALAWVAAGAAQAQSGLLGLPLDNFQFKASHNSYQRDEDMDDQIDNYNAWCLELDLNWETDCGPCITVDHCCDLVPECAGEQRLYESIPEILRSTESDEAINEVPWATFINIESADTSKGVPLPDDRYLYRAWNADWNDAASRGFNLIGTDDVDSSDTITDSRTHSPQPLYVNRLAFTADRLWGTRNYPMNHLPSAIARASPGTTLRIHPGHYPAPVTFAKPLRVQRQPGFVGVVRIGTP